MRCTRVWRTTSLSSNCTKLRPSTPLSTSVASIRPLRLPAGRSICVTSPLTTILELKPWRVSTIFICSAVQFCASSRMMKLSLSVRPQFLGDPAAHAADGAEIIGVGRHDEVDDLEPDAQFFERLEGVEDGLKLAGVELGIDLLVEAFEINVRRIDELIEVARGAVLDGAATDHDVLEIALARRFASVGDRKSVVHKK